MLFRSRNFALFGRNEGEKAQGFSALNAGLYAGINCGSVLGAIMAERLGYSFVFVLSGVFTLICAFSIMRMENAVYARPLPIKSAASAQTPKSSRMWLVPLAFVVLMIAPACISGSYLSYYLPLYFADIGRSVSDVGRAKLLYGLLIIYAGPALTRFMAKGSRPAIWNLAYNALFGSACILFGLIGGFIPALCAVFLLGFSDSL